MTDDLQRAERAKALLEDPMIKEALQSIEDELTKGWKASPAHDKDGRERIFNMICVLQSFTSFFKTAIQDGAIHAHNVQQLKRGQL